MVDFVPEAPAAPAPDSAVPVAEATPKPESTAEQVPIPEGEQQPEAAPEKTFTQSELNDILQKRLAKETRKAEREAQARESRIQQEITERMAKLQPPPPTQTDEPKPAQFQDYESYISALTDWKVEQRFGAVRQETQAQQAERERQETARQILPKLKSASEKYDDFQEVATGFQAPQAMQAAMLKSSITGELYYYIGNHPDELRRISSLDPVEQVWEIKSLEAKLKAPPAPTKAPAPIVPNDAKSASTKSTREMTDAEWDKWREADIKSKRAR